MCFDMSVEFLSDLISTSAGICSRGVGKITKKNSVQASTVGCQLFFIRISPRLRCSYFDPYFFKFSPDSYLKYMLKNLLMV